MRKIPLTQGKFAIVDDADYDWLRQFKWCALKRKNIYYAARGVKRDDDSWTTLLMHREILQPPPHLDTDHINHNGLDNRRNNLRAVTNAQNQWNRCKKYGGAYWHSKAKKWKAQIWHNRKRIHLGLYKTRKSAEQAYQVAIGKYRKPFCEG